MPLCYFVRHGTNDYIGKGLAGRLPFVHLNEQGRLEADRVSHLLATAGIQRIISSPLERARETAEPLARRLNLPVEISDQIHEIDFGDWTGLSIKELDSSEHWIRFNRHRSGTRVPNGESMLEVQSRMIGFLEKLLRSGAAGPIALFSHGDPIKLVFAYYLGVPLDLFTRIEVSTGSCSILHLDEHGPQVLAINRLPG